MDKLRANRRDILVGGSAGLATLALPSNHARAQTQGPGVTGTEIKLGAWQTTSGPVAGLGVPALRGTDAYFKLVNDQGGVNGRKITYITEDNAFSAQQTVTVARKLIENDEVLAIVCPMGTIQSEAAFPYVLGNSGVPIFGPYGGVVSWYDPPRPNLFGYIPLNEYACNGLGRWAAKDGAKKVIVAHSAIAAWVSWADQVTAGVKSIYSDANVERYPVKFGTEDYAPVALDIISKKPDAIVAIFTQPEMANLARQLRQQGSNLQIYTWPASVANALIELAKGAFEGVRALSSTVPITVDTPAVREYHAALAKYYPSEVPDYVSFNTFAGAKIFVEALKRIQGPINRESLVKAIESLKDYDSGIYPPMTYSPTKHAANSKFQRFQVAGKNWEAVADGFIDTTTAW